MIIHMLNIVVSNCRMNRKRYDICKYAQSFPEEVCMKSIIIYLTNIVSEGIFGAYLYKYMNYKKIIMYVEANLQI